MHTHHTTATPDLLDHRQARDLPAPSPVLSGQLCGCQHAPTPTPVGTRPQIHISTGGLLVVVIGGVFLTVTIGVVLTSLLLSVAVVAGMAAVIAIALALVARVIQSMARDQDQRRTGKRGA